VRGAGEERKGVGGEAGGEARPREKTYNLQQTLGKNVLSKNKICVEKETYDGNKWNRRKREHEKKRK